MMNNYKNLILQKFKETDAEIGNVFCDGDIHEYLPTIGIDYHGTVYYKIIEEFKELGIIKKESGGLVLKAYGRNYEGFEEIKEINKVGKEINNFTSKLKDDILNIICSEIPAEAGLFSLDAMDISGKVDSDTQTVLAVLKQFERRGLISNLNPHPKALRLTLMLDAVEFRDKGGFYMYEEIFKMTVEKLALEIEALQNSCPERAEKMTALLANLATISTFIYPITN